jgi:hypothetical protein
MHTHARTHARADQPFGFLGSLISLICQTDFSAATTMLQGVEATIKSNIYNYKYTQHQSHSHYINPAAKGKDGIDHASRAGSEIY